MAVRSVRAKAPISRFSRTVMPPNSRRASGTLPMPARMMAGVDRAVMSCPAKRTWPALGCSRPRITFIVVDLPLALPPSRQTIWPGCTARVSPKCTWTGP